MQDLHLCSITGTCVLFLYVIDVTVFVERYGTWSSSLWIFFRSPFHSSWVQYIWNMEITLSDSAICRVIYIIKDNITVLKTSLEPSVSVYSQVLTRPREIKAQEGTCAWQLSSRDKVSSSDLARIFIRIMLPIFPPSSHSQVVFFPVGLSSLMRHFQHVLKFLLSPDLGSWQLEFKSLIISIVGFWNLFCFLVWTKQEISFRPFVVNATFSTGLVVSSVSWLGQLTVEV